LNKKTHWVGKLGMREIKYDGSDAFVKRWKERILRNCIGMDNR
jgi:hypothetical protein